jgi:uncharacterized protein
MAGKFVLTRSGDRQFRFVLKATNREVILTGETYTSKAGAQNGIESVKQNAPVDARYERKTSSKKEPYFVLKAANGEIIGTNEMYGSVSARENGLASVKENAPGADVDDQT